jgi:formate hydrogenlyase subunit 6/NADH:ubiquinone oxidoreductase subunit I
VDACTFQEGEFPVIDKKKCIKCYCCQEFCPHDAIALNGRMFRLATLMAGANRNIE